VRIFIAVFPPDAVQAAAHETIERMRRPGDGVSWVKRDNLHYTLRFMGELGDDGARRAAEAVGEGATHHAAFDVALGGPGAFPNARNARVLWLGIERGGEPFVALANDVEASLRRHGFGKADRPFAPHLTIGRVRERDQDWSDRLAAAKPLAPSAAFRVDRVLVVHSTLSPQGSIYRPVHEAVLGAGAG
jgi:2'-5' RNA ligase